MLQQDTKVDPTGAGGAKLPPPIPAPQPAATIKLTAPEIEVLTDPKALKDPTKKDLIDQLKIKIAKEVGVNPKEVTLGFAIPETKGKSAADILVTNFSFKLNNREFNLPVAFEVDKKNGSIDVSTVKKGFLEDNLSRVKEGITKLEDDHRKYDVVAIGLDNQGVLHLCLNGGARGKYFTCTDGKLTEPDNVTFVQQGLVKGEAIVTLKDGKSMHVGGMAPTAFPEPKRPR